MKFQKIKKGKIECNHCHSKFFLPPFQYGVDMDLLHETIFERLDVIELTFINWLLRGSYDPKSKTFSPDKLFKYLVKRRKYLVKKEVKDAKQVIQKLEKLTT